MKDALIKTFRMVICSDCPEDRILGENDYCHAWNNEIESCFDAMLPLEEEDL